jgi:MFS family permease
MSVTDAAPHHRSQRPYRLLWTSNAASAVGTGMTVTAIPLVAALQPDSELILGVVAAAGILPGLLFAVPAGIATDRFDRRRLLVWADLLRALALTMAFVGVVTDRIGVITLTLTAFLVGVGETVFISASQAFVPSLVPVEDLDDANGKLQAAEDIGREFVGPPLGSMAFSVAASVPFAIDAVSYVLSAGILLGIRRPDISPEATSPDTTSPDTTGEPPQHSRPGGVGMAEAWRFFRSSRTLEVLCAAMFVLALAGSAVLAQLVLIVREQLEVPDAWYGPTIAVLALGSTVAGLLAGRMREAIPAKMALIGAVAVNALAYLTIGATSMWPVAVTALAVWGFAVTFGNITSVGVRQRIIPPELLGRTMSIFRTALGAGGLVGALGGGAVAAATSPGTLAVLAGAIQIPVVALLAVGMPHDVASRPPPGLA